jgi:prolyl-tRNA editing enzyme YbaK/EbsC (Cys-tRNA(Pro) deacylase)
METWPEPVERVAAALRASGVEARLESFTEPTPTARDAARAAGCELSQIVKSVVFLCDGSPVVALAPGDRRVDAGKVARLAGAAEARVAKPDEVLAATGFETGAVAPFPLPNVSRILMERLLLSHEEVWVGAGSRTHLAVLAPRDLLRLSRAKAADVVSTDA